MVVLVIERGPGVETKPIKTSYSTAAGTGYVTFENVHVPYENTLGDDNGGLQVILSNFNHERYAQFSLIHSEVVVPTGKRLGGEWLVAAWELTDTSLRNVSSQSPSVEHHVFALILHRVDGRHKDKCLGDLWPLKPSSVTSLLQ
jgi:hypothetical protein